jgi:AbrB family looped-hinge helix DNA binding protein
MKTVSKGEAGKMKGGELVRCFGSTTIGPRGQVVIPVSARKELGLESGDTMLVFSGFHGHGVMLLKADAIESMLSKATERITDMEKQVKDYLPLSKSKKS